MLTESLVDSADVVVPPVPEKGEHHVGRLSAVPFVIPDELLDTYHKFEVLFAVGVGIGVLGLCHMKLFAAEMGLCTGYEHMEEVQQLLAGAAGALVDDETVDDQKKGSVLIIEFVHVKQQVIAPFHQKFQNILRCKDGVALLTAFFREDVAVRFPA